MTGGYSTLITAAGTILGAILASGIGVGIKNHLRHRMIAYGITMSGLELGTKLASGSIIKSVSLGAVACLALFLVTSQVSTAAQATYGASQAQHNVSLRSSYVRFEDAIPFATTLAATGVSLGANGDFVNVIDGAAYSTNGSVLNVNSITQEWKGNAPVAPLSLAYTYTAYSSSRTNFSYPIPDTVVTLLDGTTDSVRARMNVEGVSIATTCSDLTNATLLLNNTIQILPQNPSYAEVGIELPCGRVSRLYKADEVLLYDTVACASDPTTTYIMAVSPSIQFLYALYACTSVMTAGEVRTVFDNNLRAGVVHSIPNATFSPVPAESTALLFSSLVEQVWNTTSAKGQSSLTSAFNVAALYDTPPLEVARLAVQGVSLAQALKFLDAVNILGAASSLRANGSTDTNFALQDAHLQLEIPTLRIGLTGSQKAWVALPIIVFLLLLASAWATETAEPGELDLTSASEMLTVALADRAPEFEGGATGQFPKRAKRDPRAFLVDVPPPPAPGDKVVTSSAVGPTGIVRHVAFSGQRGDAPHLNAWYA